jgi:UDP-glucose 4-epimerase
MRALVIGGNGFIGSHLVDALLTAGSRVRVFDRAPEKYRAPLAQVEYQLGNFSDMALISEALESVDVVFHLASTTVPSTSNQDPVGDIEANLVSTVRLLQLMQQQRVNRIIFLSSGGTVYGIPETAEIRESHPLHPICSYGIVKVAIENYLHMFQHLYGIQSLVLRVSNPYGPRQGHIGVQGVIGTFMSRLIEGDDIQIWGDGTIIRDYLYITDLSQLCVLAAKSSVTGVYNAGYGKGASLLEIVDYLSALCGVPVKPKIMPSRGYDVPRVILDIEKAKAEFGWRPVMDLEAGIAQTWNWLNTQKVASSK